MRLPSQIAALCLAAIATPLHARPFTVDDLLAAEEIGQIAFSPDGRHLVFERLAGQSASGPFDQDIYSDQHRSRLYVSDLTGKGPALPLIDGAEGLGVTAGPFSPDGRRMVVLRWRDRVYEVGVASLENGEIRWLGITPELGTLGRTIAWRSDTELIIAARPTQDAPLRFRVGGQMRETRARLWTDTAGGRRAALRIVGSGRFAAENLPPPAGGLDLVDIATGRIRRLASGEFYDLEPSPDGRRVAAMRRLEPLQRGTESRFYAAAAERRRNLLIVDLASGEATEPCPDCHLATHLIAWSAAAREVLVFGYRLGASEPADRYLRLAAGAPPHPVPLDGLEPVIDRTSEGYAIPRAAWLGEDPLIYARPADGGRADWRLITSEGPLNLTAGLPAPGPQFAAISDGALFLASGGFAWRLRPGQAPDRLFAAKGAAPPQGLGLSNRERVNTALATGWFDTASDGAAPVLRSTGDVLRPVPTGAGKVLAIAVGAAGAAVVRRDPGGPISVSIQTADRDARPLAHLNEGFYGVDFATVREIEDAGPDGAPITHWLMLPRARRQPSKAGARPPLIVIPYPGAVYAEPPAPYGRGTGRFASNAEVLAAAGYAVLVPSLPRGPRQAPGDRLAEQILAAVDLAAATGEVDAGRLVIMGHSFGGYAVLMAATQSDRFKAVVASAAPVDLAAHYLSMDPHAEVLPRDGLRLNSNYGWTEEGPSGLGVAPWEDPGRFLAANPLYAADRITAPVLLIHGDDDFVRLTQSQAMFSALYRQAKDAELITFFGEGHIISSPANLKAMYRLELDWLAKVLK